MRRASTVILLFVVASIYGDERFPDGVPIRVMSFNIRYGTANDGDNHWSKRKDFLAETIKTFDPDLLGTQETLAEQRDFLAKQLVGYETWGVGRDDGQNRGEMAALFYRSARFEKIDGGHFWLSESPEKVGSKGWDAALPRIASWVKLRDRSHPKEKLVFFLNTHFDHRGEKARVEAATLIRQQLGKLGEGCRCVVTGDFNAGEGSDPYKALFDEASGKPSAVVDTWRAIHAMRGKSEGTFNGFQPAATDGERIDWIACTRDWDVRVVGIDRTIRANKVPSDHFPVTAVLRPRAVKSLKTIRVLCYNIHHGEGTDGTVDLRRLAKVIRSSDPDLVAVQEVDRHTKRTKNVDQTSELALLTGLNARFGKQIDYDGGEYGQAILARLPLREEKVHLLPGEPDREQRIAFEVRATFHGHELAFVSTHLHHLKEEFRTLQVQKINELFGPTKHPVILAGDLNANPDHGPIKELARTWTIPAAKSGLLTFPASKPTKQIDYTVYRAAPTWKVLMAYVPDEAMASDHRPLVTVFQLEP